MNGNFPYQIVSNVLDPLQASQPVGFGVLSSIPQSIQYVQTLSYNGLPNVSPGIGMCFPTQQSIVAANPTCTLVNQSGVTYLAVTPSITCHPVPSSVNCLQTEVPQQALQVVQLINNGTSTNNTSFVLQNCPVTTPAPNYILPDQTAGIMQMSACAQLAGTVDASINSIQQSQPSVANFFVKSEPIDQESHGIDLNPQDQYDSNNVTPALQFAQTNQHPLNASTSLPTSLTSPQLSCLQQNMTSNTVICGGQSYIPGDGSNICFVGKQEDPSENLAQLPNTAQTFHVLVPTPQGMAIQAVVANCSSQQIVSPMQMVPAHNPLAVHTSNLVNLEQGISTIPLQTPVNLSTPQPSLNNQLSTVVNIPEDMKPSVATSENTQPTILQANIVTSHDYCSTEVTNKSELITREFKEEESGETSATMETQSTSSPDSSYCLPDSTDDLCQPTIKQSSSSIVDGIDLEEIREFARTFKMRRLFLGLTQTQVGQALCATEGPAYSQSAICRFEKLDITPRSAMKIRPVLEKWLQDAEAKYQQGQIQPSGVDYVNLSAGKIRKRRTFFSAEALAILNSRFDQNSHPSGREINSIAQDIGYDRDVVRVWFCNKRQSLRQSSSSQRGRINMKSS